MRTTAAAVLLLVVTSFPGCVSGPPLTDAQLTYQSAGAEPRHADACGPYAVSDVLGLLKLPRVTPLEASRHITTSHPGGQLLRDVLSLVHYRAGGITWPNELADAMRHYGLGVESWGGSHGDLVSRAFEIEAAGGVGVVLVREHGGVDCHYMAFPPVADAIAYNRGRATFLRVYRVTRPPV